MEEPEKPRGVRKAELWQELQRLLKVKCAGSTWPESVLDRGITNLELLKYIQALNPSHHYFQKCWQEDTDNASDGLDSSFDSAFEEQFAETVKDLPSKLADKIPKPHRRVDSEEYTDEERPAIDKEAPSQVNLLGNTSSSSQREHLLLQKIARLTSLLEEARAGEGRTGRTRASRTGSQTPVGSSLRAPPQPNQDVESVQRYTDCVDANDADEVPLSLAPRSRPHKKPTNRARKSASNFSFNSPEDTTLGYGKTYQKSQGAFASLI